MSRTLQPEDRIAHYRVVGPLGVGGMGEVYIAKDQSLERNVALKVLPADLVRNEERVRRFVTEAKSASSLSHPHIVTIYEIGQDQITSGEADAPEAGSDSVHYISMELIQGETLQDKIHHEKTDLKTLLGYLAQAAEGLAKAHASGIVHRDLKPSNIMISRDGYAKVLDFGLAKLTERTQSEDAPPDATEVADLTGEGVVLGTVGYMSPEQIRGKAVDHRSDIFSFGCLLYEAAARKRPFKADSDVETMHQILNQQPEALEELAPDVPNALRRLINRCMAKSPDKRVHSMKDVAIELADIVDEFDSLASSGSSSSISDAPVHPKGGLPVAAIVAIVAFGLAGLAVGIWTMMGKDEASQQPTQPFQSMSMTSLVSADGITSPVLSVDGRYLAYISGPAGEREVWVRQVATGSQVKIAGPEAVFSNLSFSPDGNYVFFGRPDPETPNYTAIFSVPSLGGPSRKRLFDVDSPISHSPDATQVCFRRGLPQGDQDALVIANLEDGTERIRAVIDGVFQASPPVWSPDGKSIAWAIVSMTAGLRSDIEIYSVGSGDPRRVEFGEKLFVGDAEWLPGSTSMAVIMLKIPDDTPQIWRVDTETGQKSRVTNDLNRYTHLSVGEMGAAIAAVRQSATSNVWTVAVDGTQAASQLTFGSGRADRVGEMSSTPEGELLAVIRGGDGQSIARLSADGSSREMLTPPGELSFNPTGHGEVIIYATTSGDVIVPHVWRMDRDGGGAMQLTNGSGEIPNQISNDGSFVLFARTDEIDKLWRVGVDGGEPTLIADGITSGNVALLSPDDRWVLSGSLVQVGERFVTHTMIYPSEGGPAVHSLEPARPGISNMRWCPDSASVSYQQTSGPGSENVYRRLLDGDGEMMLTDFTDGRIDRHMWSPKGDYLVVDRQLGQGSAIWLVPISDGVASGPARELVSYPMGQIEEIEWLAGKGLLAYQHVTADRDVVLIRDF